MPYQRGDVIELSFLIPGKNITEKHPAIIISNQEVYNLEEIYVCVMATHSNLHAEEFGFELTKEMFVDPKHTLNGYAKAHLISYVLENQIITNSKRGKMKRVYLQKLVDFINDTILCE